ncbi:MAG: SCO family protein [Deltaproteobacteria bacterium]|nr:SCO family protein [Deltaproteobacteria bacterium]
MCIKKNRAIFVSAAALIIFALSGFGASAKDADMQELKDAFDASVAVEGKRVGDYGLIDQDGRRFTLSDYFKGSGKPLVVSFIYTSCPEVCPTITARLKSAADNARAKFGDRFRVLSVGFDAENDTPAALRKYGLKYTKDFASFTFAAASPETARRMTEDFGFFWRKKADGSFDHIDMVTVVNRDGVIYKQVYSMRTQGATLGSRLDELLTGKPIGKGDASLIDKLKYFCYRYDPYTGEYVLDYPVFLSVFIQLAVILAIVYAVWGKRIMARIRKG